MKNTGQNINIVRNYRFDLEELVINRNEIAEMLGFETTDIPEPFLSYIEEGIADATDLCDIQGSVVIADNIEFHENYSQFSIDGKLFDAGKLVTRQLKKSSSLILFICTAGEGIGVKSQKLLHGEDPAKGYVYDVLGSIIVETAIDRIQNLLRSEFLDSNLNITNRYSPGYCNWDVKDQHVLFSFFPKKHCGILLNSSALMHPIKSVSGVIGLGENVKFRQYTCEVCNSTTCIYRKLRRHKS